MGNKLIILFLLVICIQTSAQVNPLNQITPEGLLLDPSSLIYSQFQSGELSQFMDTYNIIKNPESVLLSQIQLDPNTQKFLQTSNSLIGYMKSSKTNDYNLKLNDEGTVSEGAIVYEQEDGRDLEVSLNGVKPGEEGEFSCTENCKLVIGKNTYLIDEKNSNFKLSDRGELESANFLVNKKTQMFFGDRAYTVNPNTNINYTLLKNEKGEKSYEVLISSKENSIIELDFPKLDENGIPIPRENYNYAINGKVKFTDKGLEVYSGGSIIDKNLKYSMINNGEDSVLITGNRKHVYGNYILANKNEFEFSLKDTEISLSEGNPWIKNIPYGESLDIIVKDFGSGYIEDNSLINIEGKYLVRNCDSEKLVTETHIIETKSGTNCIALGLVTDKGNIVDDYWNINACTATVNNGIDLEWRGELTGLFFTNKIKEGDPLMKIGPTIYPECISEVYMEKREVISGICFDIKSQSTLINQFASNAIKNCESGRFLQLTLQSGNRDFYIIVYNYNGFKGFLSEYPLGSSKYRDNKGNILINELESARKSAKPIYCLDECSTSMITNSNPISNKEIQKNPVKTNNICYKCRLDCVKETYKGDMESSNNNIKKIAEDCYLKTIKDMSSLIKETACAKYQKGYNNCIARDCSELC